LRTTPLTQIGAVDLERVDCGDRKLPAAAQTAIELLRIMIEARNEAERSADAP
jgi:hypothetical protein